MDPRNGAAIAVGVALAVICCASLTAAGFGAGALLVVAFVLCPLVVSLIARSRVLLFALLPNLIIGFFFSIVGAFSPYNRAHDGGFSDETFVIVPIVLAMSVGCAILVAAVVWVLRAVWRESFATYRDAEQIGYERRSQAQRSGDPPN
jgi:hypothetical protein